MPYGSSDAVSEMEVIISIWEIWTQEAVLAVFMYGTTSVGYHGIRGEDF